MVRSGLQAPREAGARDARGHHTSLEKPAVGGGAAAGDACIGHGIAPGIWLADQARAAVAVLAARGPRWTTSTASEGEDNRHHEHRQSHTHGHSNSRARPRAPTSAVLALRLPRRSAGAIKNLSWPSPGAGSGSLARVEDLLQLLVEREQVALGGVLPFLRAGRGRGRRGHRRRRAWRVCRGWEGRRVGHGAVLPPGIIRPGKGGDSAPAVGPGRHCTHGKMTAPAPSGRRPASGERSSSDATAQWIFLESSSGTWTSVVL